MSRPAKIALVGGIALAVLGGLGTLGYNAWQKRGEAIAESKAWTVAGPPCPQLSAEAFRASGMRVKKGSEINGVTFMRVAGHLHCTELVNDGGRGFGKYTVCQFTAPSVLTVTTDKGVFHFNPGPGRGATVEVHKGVATCVIGGTFGA